MNGLVNQERNDYRAFRERIVVGCDLGAPCVLSCYYSEGEGSRSYSRRREQIAEFREAVRHLVAELLSEDPQDECHVRRALGIPNNISLNPRDCSTWRSIGQFFVPTIFGARKARALLVQVKTYEGRRYIFDNLIAPEFAWHSTFPGPVGFSPSLDILLRRLALPSSWPELDGARSLDNNWLKIARRFDLEKMPELVAMARYGNFQLDGELAWMLVQEGVVRTRQELSRLGRKKESYGVSADAARGYKRQARQMIRVLLDHEVDRGQIATIFEYDMHFFNSQKLDTNLTALRAAGVVELSSVFESVGQLLWRASTESWAYVLRTLGASSSADIARFSRVLDSHQKLPVDFALALKSLGADLLGLAQCQSLILCVGEGDEEKRSINELKLLASPPFGLSIEQISQCTGYLSEPEKVEPFLSVLAKHGYVSGAAVLSFQDCYQKLSVDDVDAWLSIVDSVRGQPLPDVVADWVRQAGSGGHIDACCYLQEATDLDDFRSLQQALPIVHLGREMLSYLVEVRDLRTVQALKKWYYKARGIESLRIGHRKDEISRLLLDDAYTRNNFSVLSGNEGQIYSAVSRRVESIIGRRPYAADEVVRVAYQQRYSQQDAVERHALLGSLPIVLEQTGGVLLSSVLRHAWEGHEALYATLDRLEPLVHGLLTGGGPAGSQLDELEADAIAMLYRTSSSTLTSLWPRVVNNQADLSWLKLQGSYPMIWQRSFRRLNGTLERQSLLALAQAAAFAKHFSLSNNQTISEACKHLRAKRLFDNARDPWSLIAHVGVLLAAARDDSMIAEWISGGLESASQMADEGAQTFERIEQLGRLFDSDLPDALDKHTARFLGRFDDGDARFLAERLVGSENTRSGSSKEQLDDAFALVRSNVLEACLRWVARERGKFVRDKTEHTATNLVGVVSKHPAAFFAKHAATLCSRDNTAMWEESRQAHLVVFDQARRSLAGMALVYFQILPELHASKKCLVIRAINPMDEMLATHTESSIVDSFFDVVVTIAQENSLAAVVFPESNGSHLLSNRDAIEKNLQKRFVAESADTYGRWPEPRLVGERQDLRRTPLSFVSTFYAYEHGAEKVGRLYTIWLGAEDSPNESECLGLEGVA
ncbi:hypothetical protein [Pseudomonas sp. B21-035]|uniref:hypothetical protein n=1 Tax=Pseudomonas sp. B21-035 TaxID=2895484 RepID=UPI00215FB908|nr:hypothetical protein [Pseudomonas sp. B21-035]UVL57625.1 hypothetical protein LOY22_06530 [Pseudomonas sp. B21-035]